MENIFRKRYSFYIDAQHFIIDNLDAVAATEAKKGKTNNQALQNNGESDD